MKDKTLRGTQVSLTPDADRAIRYLAKAWADGGKPLSMSAVIRKAVVDIRKEMIANARKK